jgi:hypothetical protein
MSIKKLESRKSYDIKIFCCKILGRICDETYRNEQVQTLMKMSLFWHLPGRIVKVHEASQSG